MRDSFEAFLWISQAAGCFHKAWTGSKLPFKGACAPIGSHVLEGPDGRVADGRADMPK